MISKDYEFNPDILRFDKFAIHCMAIRGMKPSPMQLDAIKFLTFGHASEVEWMGVSGTPKEVNTERRALSNNLCLLALRGWFKTTLMAMYCAYWIYTNPSINIGYISNSTNTIQALMRDVKALIEQVPELAPFRDVGVYDKKTNSTQSKFRTKYAQDKEQTLWTAPLKGTATGLRAKLIILDDIEIRDNSNTPEKVADLWSRITEYLRLVDSGTQQQFLMVGTPWSTESVYYRACLRVDDGGLGMKGRAYPARFPKLDEVPDYKGILAPFLLDQMVADESLIGTVTDPERIKEELLMTQYRADKIEYYMNYMMNPFVKSADNYSFSLEDIGLIRYRSIDNYPPPFIVDTQPHTKKPELVPFAPNKDCLHLTTPNLQSTSSYRATKRILYIDPSGGGEDETAYCVLASVNGNFVLERVGGYVDGASEATLDALIDVYNSFKTEYGNCIHQVVFEKNFGAGMYRKLFDARAELLGYAIPTYDHQVQGHKFQRIQDTLSPVIKGHKFFITEECVDKDLVDYNDSSLSMSERNVLKQYTFMYQLTYFYWSRMMTKTTSPFGVTGHDDRLDAVSSAVLYLGNLIAPTSDAELEEIQYRDEQIFDNFCKVFGEELALEYFSPLRYPHLQHLHNTLKYKQYHNQSGLRPRKKHISVHQFEGL